ncbi:hypothetical protein [Acidovorax radicis]|uniref:hypothetical protein n=1 Tax=Acidovorax radicis TaxID=758826 RepID=UPI00023762AB
MHRRDARQAAVGAQCITVSTPRESGQFFAGGVTDILYAVGMMVPHKTAARAGGAAAR